MNNGVGELTTSVPIQPIKAITIGDSEAGKTTIVRILNGADEVPRPVATAGVDLAIFKHTIPGTKKTTRVTLFDTAGMERFRSITQSYFRGADIILLVCAIDEHITDEWRGRWLIDYLLERPMMLIASKMDLYKEDEHSGNLKSLEQLAADHGMLFAAVTSTDPHALRNSIWPVFTKGALACSWQEPVPSPIHFVPYQPDDPPLPPLTELDAWNATHTCMC